MISLTASTGVRCQWGGRRDLTGTRRFLCRLQQFGQLGDIRHNAPRLIFGEQLGR